MGIQHGYIVCNRKEFRLSLLWPITNTIFPGMFRLFPPLRFSHLGCQDSFQGAYHRWQIPFNFSMLRLVSFSMDYYWACRSTGPAPVCSHTSHTVAQYPDPMQHEARTEMNHRQRTTTRLDIEMYNFKNYIAYLMYPPLFLAGPIMTFNDFMWQVRLL